MKFQLSIEAGNDLTEIAEYLRSIPSEPGLRIGRSLQRALARLSRQPYLAHTHKELSSLAREEIRCTVEGSYVLFLAAERTPVVFLGVIYGKRDVDSIMRERLS